MVAEIVLLSLVLAVDAFWLVFAIFWNKKNFVKQLHHRVASFAFLALQLFLIPLFLIQMKNPVLVGAFVTYTAGLWLFSLVLWVWNFFYCIYLKGNVLVKRTLFRKTEIVLTEEGTFFKQGSDGISASRPAAFVTSVWWMITVVSADGSASISFSVRHAEGDGQALLRKMETLVPEYVGVHYKKKGKFKITKKVLRDSIVVSIVFNSGKRKAMPALNKAQDGGSYRPHFVVDGTFDYLGGGIHRIRFGNLRPRRVCFGADVLFGHPWRGLFQTCEGREVFHNGGERSSRPWRGYGLSRSKPGVE